MSSPQSQPQGPRTAAVDPLLRVRDLQKHFAVKQGLLGRKKKAVRAVDGVTFQCHPGEVFGLLGPNGAGKTTTLRIISTALRPSAGSSIVIFGVGTVGLSAVLGGVLTGCETIIAVDVHESRLAMASSRVTTAR